MAYITSSGGGGGSSDTTIIKDADNNTKIQVEEGSDENKIRFDTAGTERMIIDETGKVGLGVSAPTAPLHIRSGLGTDPTLLVESISPDTATHGPTIAFNSNVTAAATPSFVAVGRMQSGSNTLTDVVSPSPISIGMYIIDQFGGFIGVDGRVTAISGDPIAGGASVTFSGTPGTVNMNPGTTGNFTYSVAPTNADKVGEIDFNGSISSTPGASGGTESVTTFANMGVTTTTTDTTPDGALSIQVVREGSLEPRIEMFNTGTMVNTFRRDLDFDVNGNGSLYTLHVDAGDNRVGIGTNAAVAKLDVVTGGDFRSTRLLTVAVSGGTTLSESAHAGRYLICSGNVILPESANAGEHYTILNTTSGNITVTPGEESNINGAASAITVATFDALTCIGIGSNNWIAIG